MGRLRCVIRPCYGMPHAHLRETPSRASALAGHATCIWLRVTASAQPPPPPSRPCIRAALSAPAPPARQSHRSSRRARVTRVSTAARGRRSHLRRPAGTILGVVGPSGSGKTTTVRMLTGTLGRTDGEIRCWARIRCGSAARPRRGSPTCRSCSACTRTSPRRRTSASSRHCMVSARSSGATSSARARGRRSGRRAASAGARPVGRDAAAARARLRAGAQPGRPVRRRADRRHRSAAAHSPSGTSCAGLRDEGRTLLVTTQYVAEAEYCDRVALIVDGELVALDSPTRCARWYSAAT